MVGNSPCASCKLLRRRCAKDCIFAPYFPSDDPQKFAIVHKVFGASNVSKMLQELPVDQRSDAVSSLVYEANARVRDPVYGCVGAISYLQNQVSELQMQLAVAQAEILCIQMQHHPEPLLATTTSPSTTTIMPNPSSHNNIIIDHTTTDDQKPYIFHHQNDHVLLPSHHHHHQYLNFASNNSNNVIHDSLSRESIFGHDMVS